MAAAPQQFCVRWNSYYTNLQSVFPRLLLTEQFADVTLACESRQVRCHKLVLSACSAYLERLLLQNPCEHPIVFMRDMRFSEMQALVDFMYKGEVNVTQDELPSLLKSAEALQIRGLCSSDTNGLSDLVKPGAGAPSAAGAPAAGDRDFAVATEALLAQAQRDAAAVNGTTTPTTTKQQKSTTTTTTNSQENKKRKNSEASHAEVKEETVEEDGLYYGEMDNDPMEYNEDEDTGKPGSSLGQTSDSEFVRSAVGVVLSEISCGQFLRVKPESELLFHTKLATLAKSSEYMQMISKMDAAALQKEFTKYGLMKSDEAKTKEDNDFYKSWLEQNGELEVSLLKASERYRKPALENHNKSEVELIPKNRIKGLSDALREKFAPKIGELPRRRGRPPIFKDRNLDIGDTVLKSDLDQFLEGKEISSSGLSRKDLERVMMGKYNPNRRYSNEAMWAALMDVKKGGSIYRAAQTHKVPRKSLRNWMKRCHIKSSFPMPQQLKQFVENSKKQKEYQTTEIQNDTEIQNTEIRNATEVTNEGEIPYSDLDFGKHFLSFSNQVSSEDENLGTAKSDEDGKLQERDGNTAIDMTLHE